MKKENVRATVVSCIPSETVIQGTACRCFEITVEFNSSNGLVSKSYKRGNAMEEGTILIMCYNPNNGALEMETALKTKNKNTPVLAGVCCSLLLFVALIVLGAKFNVLNDKGIGCLIGVALLMVFMWVGIYITFIFPRKHRNTEACVMLEGRISKYVKTNRGVWWAAHYSAVYEYIYDGKICRVGSTEKGNRRKAIGTKVTIALNKDTGEAFCVEEQRSYYIWGGLWTVISLGLMVIMIVEMFKA